MQTIEQVQAAINKLGVKIVNSQKSYKELHKHLKETEVILAVCDTPISLAIVTNERFLRLTTSAFSPTDVAEVYLKTITNIQVDAGFLATKLFIISAGGKIDLVVSNKEIANKLKNELNEAISKANAPVAASPQIDIYTQLEKLAQLKEKGILTEAEFTEQKQKLLSQS